MDDKTLLENASKVSPDSPWSSVAGAWKDSGANGAEQPLEASGSNSSSNSSSTGSPGTGSSSAGGADVAQPVMRRKNEATSVSSEHSSVHFRVGVTADKNSRHRRTMEDVHGCDLRFGGKEDQGLFYILDGHGGKGVADYCGTALPKNIAGLLSSSPNLSTEQLFTLAFILTDEQLEQENLVNSGATVIVSLVRTELVNDKPTRVLHTANAGDARAILCRGTKSYRLSKDHKATDEDEIARIDASGGMVMGGRVNGVLAVARALGDIHMKEQVVSTPFVSSVALTPDDKFMVLACDGVWDVMSNQEVVNLVMQYSDAKEASAAIVRQSMKMGSTDNITAMVVFFNNPEGAGASTPTATTLPSLSSQPTELVAKDSE